MSKYLGPKLKIIRRLGCLPGFTSKKINLRIKTPGQHGKLSFLKGTNKSFLSDDYKKRLFEKQKIRFNYGISEKQLFLYYQKVKKQQGSTSILLLSLLEFRFDCIIYRLGYASTIKAARQLILHGHFLINNKKINIPSFQCKINDIITVKNNKNSKQIILNILKNVQEKNNLLSTKINSYNLLTYSNILKLPSHLERNINLLTGKIINNINPIEFLLKINILKIIEYYSYY